MPGFHFDEEILFSQLAAPLPSLTCSLHCTPIFRVLSLVCHASLCLVLSCICRLFYPAQGFLTTPPCAFFLFCLPSISSYLPTVFLPGHKQREQFELETCWHSLPGSFWRLSILPPDFPLPQLYFSPDFSSCQSADVPNPQLPGRPRQPQLRCCPQYVHSKAEVLPHSTV